MKKSMTPNNLGKNYLTDQCRQIKINDLMKKARKEFKKTFIKSNLNVSNINIEVAESKTGFNGIRYWFACPKCQKRIGVLYKHPLNKIIACRQCLGLKYRKNRYKGMVEEKIGK
ncbi:MAG: hypothetical protein GF347_02750 [Candidatus Moranbacteria bacterium]|nr:hypothetical protein [Candidatus Moranbacteria bacterium]